jgi:thioredoxin 1
MSTPIMVSEATFAAQVLESELPVVVDFGAPWCPPCRAIEPFLRELAAEYQGRLRVAAVNVDDEPALAARYGITGLPTLVFFHGSQEVQRLRGAAPKSKLQAAFEPILAGSAAVPA